MTTLSNAPLRYVLAIIHFPPILNMEKYVPTLQEAFRDAYPELDAIESQTLTTNSDADGIKLNITAEKVWQFARTDRSMAVVLGSDFLVLHCAASYPGHGEFIRLMGEAVACLRGAEGVRVASMTALGYRYIDLIEAMPGEAVTDYLAAWVLTKDAPKVGNDGIVLQQSSYQALFQVDDGTLRFHAHLRPPATMPPDLASPFLHTNGWHTIRPTGDFAILDFDHGRVLKPPLPLDPEHAAAHLTLLHGPTRRLFDEAVTEHAIKTWSSP